MIDILNDIRYGRSPGEVQVLIQRGRLNRRLRYLYKRRGAKVLIEILSDELCKMKGSLNALSSSVKATTERMDALGSRFFEEYNRSH